MSFFENFHKFLSCKWAPHEFIIRSRRTLFFSTFFCFNIDSNTFFFVSQRSNKNFIFISTTKKSKLAQHLTCVHFKGIFTYRPFTYLAGESERSKSNFSSVRRGKSETITTLILSQWGFAIKMIALCFDNLMKLMSDGKASFSYEV